MAKRPGPGQHDATQKLSESQILPTERPVLHRGSGAKNDMSVWGGVVVGTSDFAPAPEQRARTGRWKWIVAGGVALGGIAITVYLLVAGGEDTRAAAPVATPAPAPAVDAAAVAAPPPDAAVAAASPPAPDAVVAAAIDAGVAPGEGAAVEVDAISGVAAVIKPSAKKQVVRKKPGRKKKRR